MAKYLIHLWEEEWKKKNLPPEWSHFEDFRIWAVEHGYKADYGYKGEFTPTGCLAAIPGRELIEQPPKTATKPKGGANNAGKKANPRGK